MFREQGSVARLEAMKLLSLICIRGTLLPFRRHYPVLSFKRIGGHSIPASLQFFQGGGVALFDSCRMVGRPPPVDPPDRCREWIIPAFQRLGLGILELESFPLRDCWHEYNLDVNSDT